MFLAFSCQNKVTTYYRDYSEIKYRRPAPVVGLLILLLSCFSCPNFFVLRSMMRVLWIPHHGTLCFPLPFQIFQEMTDEDEHGFNPILLASRVICSSCTSRVICSSCTPPVKGISITNFPRASLGALAKQLEQGHSYHATW